MLVFSKASPTIQSMFPTLRAYPINSLPQEDLLNDEKRQQKWSEVQQRAIALGLDEKKIGQRGEMCAVFSVAGPRALLETLMLDLEGRGIQASIEDMAKIDHDYDHAAVRVPGLEGRPPGF